MVSIIVIRPFHRTYLGLDGRQIGQGTSQQEGAASEGE